MTTKLNFEVDRETWAAIVLAEGRGERVSPEDAELRARFEASNPEVIAEEAWLWAGIGALGQAPPGSTELSDAAMMERVLAQAAGRAGAVGGPSAAPVVEKGAGPGRVIALGRPRTRRGIAAAFGAFALAAALAALASEMLRSGPTEPAPGSNEAPAAAPSEGPGASRGRGRGAATEAEPAESAQAEAPPAPSTTVESSENTNGLNAPAVAGPSAAGAPAIVSAATEPHAEKVAASDVKAREAPVETADSLLKSAQAQLASGSTAGAVAAYKDLLARYPSSAEARAALISLGRLSLGGGAASEALAYFDRYLAGAGGPLSVEARYGRIQALRRLGRGGDEAAAIQDFLGRHGDSVYAPRLRERLASLSPSGPDSAPEAPGASPKTAPTSQ